MRIVFAHSLADIEEQRAWSANGVIKRNLELLLIQISLFYLNGVDPKLRFYRHISHQIAGPGYPRNVSSSCLLLKISRWRGQKQLVISDLEIKWSWSLPWWTASDIDEDHTTMPSRRDLSFTWRSFGYCTWLLRVQYHLFLGLCKDCGLLPIVIDPRNYLDATPSPLPLGHDADSSLRNNMHHGKSQHNSGPETAPWIFELM